jgi:hypothetical protein
VKGAANLISAPRTGRCIEVASRCKKSYFLDQPLCLHHRPNPERYANKRDENAAHHLAVALKRSETDALQARGRVDTKRDVGDDCRERKNDGHRTDDAHAILARGEEGWNPFDHRRRSEDQQQGCPRRRLVVVGMLRRCRLQRRRHLMGCGAVVIVPMGVNGPAAVPVRVAMARHDSHLAARRRVERIILRVEFFIVAVIVPLAMVGMVMIVFGETRAIRMRLAAVIERHRHVKTVRLGNFVHRLPERAALGEWKHLPRAGLAKRLHLHLIGLRAGQPKSGRNAMFENR